jgi:hypothetical protein
MSKKKKQALQRNSERVPQVRPPLVDPAAAMLPLTLSMQLNQQTLRTQTSSGPLPPPEVLAKYDTIIPGMVERIVKLAEGGGRTSGAE